MTKRILITPGEPAGIGPDITVQIAQQNWDAKLIVIADPTLLQTRAQQLNLPLRLIECDVANAELHQPGTLQIIPVALAAKVEPGKLNPANAGYVKKTLELAAELCLKKKADAIVTGPVHKETMNQAGIGFTGHTEFFADYSGVKQTVMLFVVDKLRVALVTTHLALADVPRAITKEKLRLIIAILHDELKTRFNIANPRLLICGLNPHAGEGGYLGREEIDIINPLLAELTREGYSVRGALPADTIFTPKLLAESDCVLAMYHDQALPLVKYAGFGHAVNVTLGLPFLRTSVDHGTAIDLAGSGQADPGSLAAAISLAVTPSS